MHHSQNQNEGRETCPTFILTEHLNDCVNLLAKIVSVIKSSDTYLSLFLLRVVLQRTDCKAVVSVLPEQAMGPEGFQLSITLSDVHLPRMWVEKHPDKDSQVCLSAFNFLCLSL